MKEANIAVLQIGNPRNEGYRLLYVMFSDSFISFYFSLTSDKKCAEVRFEPSCRRFVDGAVAGPPSASPGSLIIVGLRLKPVKEKLEQKTQDDARR